MKSLFNYIISTKSRYNNKVNVDTKELILNTEITERDYVFVNRVGKVLSEPAYGITSKTPRKGDDVIVHHNIFSGIVLMNIALLSLYIIVKNGTLRTKKN